MVLGCWHTFTPSGGYNEYTNIGWQNAIWKLRNSLLQIKCLLPVNTRMTLYLTLHNPSTILIVYLVKY